MLVRARSRHLDPRVGVPCARMEIVSAGPLPVASVLWQPAPHAFAITFVCRGTFRLAPVESELAAEQDAPSEEDTYWNDDPSRSLSAPSDLAPFKPRADVILVGNAYAPRGEPVRSLVARLKVGDVDKSIEVFGERAFTQEGQLREGARVVRVPLRWERAAGGPGTSNPVGMRLDVEDTYGATAIPNLQPIGLHLDRRGQHMPPVGFGPIAPSWPARRELLGRHAASWPGGRWMQEPLPDIEPAFFNAAPRDQQVTALRDDEQIILEHLHPDHPRLVTSLPGVRPQARIERRGTQEDVPMHADTLWIDTARGICTLTWRGRVALEHPAEPGRVLIALDTSRRRAPLRSVPIDETMRTMVEPPRPKPSSALPFVAGAPAESPAAHADAMSFTLDDRDVVDAEEDVTGTAPGFSKIDKRAALPFIPAPASPLRVPTPGSRLAASHVAPIPPASAPHLTPVPPPHGASASQHPPAPLVASSPAPHPSFAPVPPPHGASASQHPPAPHPSFAPVHPLHAVSMPATTAPSIAANIPSAPALYHPPVSTAPIAPRVDATPWAATASQDGARRADAGTVSPLLATDAVSMPNAAAGGVLVASDLAAGTDRAVRIAEADDQAAPVAPMRARAAREIVKLVWFDPTAVQRIRKHLAFRRLLADLEMRLVIEAEADIAGGPIPDDVKDRRAVLEVLLHGDAVSADGVRQAVDGAVRDDGGFEPPLAVVSAELEMPFDELETLKATATAVRPLASSDKRLKESLDLVDPLLATPWLNGSGSIAESLTAKLREAFAQGKRAVAPDYLNAHAERMLLEQRAYQRRALFGKKWIRSVMRAASGAVPVYLPEETKDGLPMFRRFPARMLAEIDLREDEGETSPWSIRVLALGRVLGPIA
ncbi:D-alanyl-D-alanine carboxypeptidase [Minicystis rosea]|nr:D-alanyl-D-alanine carboxypeptidase [Minicystis rosea]